MSKNNINIENFHIPRWDELPNIDLFLEQVVTLVTNTLEPYIFLNKKEDGELLTKTMINNYVKNNIIEAPVKKKYSKKHISKIFVICVLKQVYSMQDIKLLIKYALKDMDISICYNSFCTLFEEALNCAYNKKDFIDNKSQNDDQYLLKSVLLSCSYKIYVKNITNEKIPNTL